jgi:DegV family protein with EDD domain
MSPVVVITDSTASLPEDLYAQYQIVMVPYYLHFADRVARDMVDIRPPEFNAYLTNLPDKAELPKTANPGPGDYLKAYLAAAERGREIISFHMTSHGSGAYQAASIGREMALQRLQGVRIAVMDTLNVSMCHGWMALQAARAAAQGATLDDISALVHRMIPTTRMIQTADTLRYLYMGGRIGRAKHLVGSLLHVKPLISMEGGDIVTLGVARTRQGVFARMAALVQKAVGSGARIRLALTHAAAAQAAEELRQSVAELVAPVEVLFCELDPALIVHSGPGTVGLCYVPEEASSW